MNHLQLFVYGKLFIPHQSLVELNQSVKAWSALQQRKVSYLTEECQILTETSLGLAVPSSCPDVASYASCTKKETDG
jgi:hypothetical protein